MVLGWGMCSRVLIILANPDSNPVHLGHDLAQAYKDGAEQAGREVRVLKLAELDVPYLRGAHEWKKPLPKQLHGARDDLLWAEHLVIVTPLWMGDMPALLKAFLEQILRPGIAFDGNTKPKLNSGLLCGRSARVIMTMGMPAWFYHVFYGAPAMTLLRRQILKFVGYRPVRGTCIGMVDSMSKERYVRLMNRMRRMGRRGV